MLEITKKGFLEAYLSQYALGANEAVVTGVELGDSVAAIGVSSNRHPDGAVCVIRSGDETSPERWCLIPAVAGMRRFGQQLAIADACDGQDRLIPAVAVVNLNNGYEVVEVVSDHHDLKGTVDRSTVRSLLSIIMES